MVRVRLGLTWVSKRAAQGAPAAGTRSLRSYNRVRSASRPSISARRRVRSRDPCNRKRENGLSMTMTPTMKGRMAVLRAPVPSDQADRQACGRDQDFIRMVGGDATTATDRLSDSDADAWYRGVADDPFRWIIEAGGRAVGTIRLHQLNETDRSVRLAIGIFDPAWRGKGLGTESTRLLLRYALKAASSATSE